MPFFCCFKPNYKQKALRKSISKIPQGQLEGKLRVKAANFFLPYDLIVVIVTFIPVRSLSQCSLISSSWSSAAVDVGQQHTKESEELLRKGIGMISRDLHSESSLRLFSRALDVNPRLAEASFWTAQSMSALGKLEDAQKCLVTAILLHPPIAEQLKLEATELSILGNDIEACILLEGALQISPCDTNIWFELGVCYHAMEDFSQAVQAYTKAELYGYHRLFVLFANRAKCLAQLDRMDEALNDLEACLRLNPHYEVAL